MKLVNRYVASYVSYAAIVLCASVPIVYFSVQFLVAKRIDQNLVRQKKLIVNSIGNFIPSDSASHLVFLEPGVQFRPALPPFPKDDQFSVVQRFDTTDHDNEPYRILETTVYIHEKPYLLELSSSLLDKEELISSIVVIVFVILLFIIAGLVFINRALSEKIWNPFYQTLTKLNDYKIEEDQVLYFEKTSIEEFAYLNKVIHSLTCRNADVFQSQKAFIENASHEMQTPVAIQQVKLELLMQTEPLSEGQYSLISSLLDITLHTSVLHNCLLLLSKIDNRQFRDSELFSGKIMVENLVEQYKFQADIKEVDIRLQLTDDLLINANKGLIEIMLGNLLGNAIRHNTVGGTVYITCLINTIIFTNTGIDQPLDKNKLFQRFQKQSALNISAGLGLHIAKKIAEYYQYDLNYSFRNKHHSFVLILQ